MTMTKTGASAPVPANNPFLTVIQGLPLALAAVCAYHVAYSEGMFSFLVAVFLFCLFRLTFLKNAWLAMAFGTGIGLAVYVPHLTFFWTLFGGLAIVFWLIVSCWVGFFLVLGNLTLRSFGIYGVAALAPFLWMGLEYFRSELYFLRFSWLTPGLAFANAGELPFVACYGVYGISFVILVVAALFLLLPTLKKKARIVALIFLGAVLLYPAMVEMQRKSVVARIPKKTLHVAGIEMRSPSEKEVLEGLTQLVAKCPEAELLLMAEFTFRGPVPESVKQWCKTNSKHLIVGGKDPLENGDYYNTAFVVDSQGEIVFKQAKSRPVQFLKDGLPAKERKLWNSPWGPIAIAVCNDSGYRRALDDFAKQGAVAFVIPTLDAANWGEAQHRLHGGIVQMRAAEYHVPVFRLCGTGVSEFVATNGVVLASTPFAVERSILESKLELGPPARLPADRWLNLVAVIITAAAASWFASLAVLRWRLKRKVGQRKV